MHPDTPEHLSAPQTKRLRQTTRDNCVVTAPHPEQTYTRTHATAHSVSSPPLSPLPSPLSPLPSPLSPFPLPCLGLPCLALPCLALPCLALPCLSFPFLSFPSAALPSAARLSPTQHGTRTHRGRQQTRHGRLSAALFKRRCDVVLAPPPPASCTTSSLTVRRTSHSLRLVLCLWGRLVWLHVMRCGSVFSLPCRRHWRGLCWMWTWRTRRRTVCRGLGARRLGTRLHRYSSHRLRVQGPRLRLDWLLCWAATREPTIVTNDASISPRKGGWQPQLPYLILPLSVLVRSLKLLMNLTHSRNPFTSSLADGLLMKKYGVVGAKRRSASSIDVVLLTIDAVIIWLSRGVNDCSLPQKPSRRPCCLRLPQSWC